MGMTTGRQRHARPVRRLQRHDERLQGSIAGANERHVQRLCRSNEQHQRVELYQLGSGGFQRLERG